MRAAGAPRRRVLQGALGLGLLASAGQGRAEAFAPDAPRFTTSDARWQGAYDRALAVLAGNVATLPAYPLPLLIEGSEYGGVWLECAPFEALTFRRFRPDLARNNHLVFFALQRPDGQLPANTKRASTGWGQIQMVTPVAATAWELARATGDGELLETAYRGACAWDAWLVRWRDTRGTGLTEGFCTYDTGMDNSPRWAGVPNACPDHDARAIPAAPGVPRLCPDLSATVYGGRVALAGMARALGRTGEADRWTQEAEAIRARILQRLYSPQDAAFYDLDAQNRFVRVRSDVISRVCAEQVPDRALFETLWTRQLGAPAAFWAPYPFPSVARDDPAYRAHPGPNSWGGPSQALTALRAGRWMEPYGRAAEFAELMSRWCEALRRDRSFRQQLDPETGAFDPGDLPGYSPAALVLIDFTWRLAGVREEGGELHWTVRPNCPAAASARFEMRTDAGRTAELRYAAAGAECRLAGRQVARIEGGTARLVTDPAGRARSLLGVAAAPQIVTLSLPDAPPRQVRLSPNQALMLRSACA